MSEVPVHEARGNDRDDRGALMGDSVTMDDLWTIEPIASLRPGPIDRAGLVERLRLTGLSAAYALSMAPALLLALLWVIALPTALAAGAGVVLALGVVPAAEALTGVHRRVSGALLGERIPAAYADPSGTAVVLRPLRWLSDPVRWRDFGQLWFSATGGFALSLVPVALLVAPVSHVVGLLLDPSWVWALLVALDVPVLVLWWLVTPVLVRARASTERGILGGGETARLSARVAEVEETRMETLDHSAAEIRRIERDLHDGAQARIAAVGMSVGLAEKLMATDPEAAAALLREAREGTVGALEDLRGVVRGIMPPVLADRGLAAGVEALAVGLPLPVTVSLAVPDGLPEPVSSAVYFAVAECLANTVKHAGATRAFVGGSHNGTRLRVAVGDDGGGGADPSGHGLSGIASRLAAFDGSVSVDSPHGGPTVITMEVPCQV